MKIRTKIALVFTIVTGGLLLGLSSFVYFRTLQHVNDNFLTLLRVRASIAADSHHTQADAELIERIRDRHLERLPMEREFVFARNLLEDGMAKELPEVPAFFAEDILRSGTSDYHYGFQHFVGIAHESNSNHVVVAMAYDENGEEQMSFLFKVIAIGFSVSTLIVLVGGRVFARHVMRPISAINGKVNTITASDLGERLPEGSSSDEIAELAKTFNTMLDRLETAFELQSNFISNASHELRTPLTSILGESEVILGASRTEAEYVDSIKTIQHEARKLDEVTASLLKLSQISFDGKRQKIEPVSMDELLMSLKISLDKRVPNNLVKVLLQPTDDDSEKFALMCVRIWMELAITNIIQNSIKYSDNKEVLVTLTSDGGHFLVQMSDEGIGIPAAELPNILEPFFRASNTSRYNGYGIGLPLAARIIKLHGGKMDVVSKEGVGTQVSLKFPCMTGGVKN